MPIHRHRRFTTLGPGTAFLTWHDFYALLGSERPATIKEFCQIIIAGHKRVLDEYRLIVPTFEEDLPSDITPDLIAWWQEHKTQVLQEEAQREAERAAREAEHRLWQELLFEAPMRELAVRFGVRETAIRKRVKTAGLSLPPRGHWLRKS